MTTELVAGGILENGIFYPSSDGEPMSENTAQYKYIVLLKEGLEELFKDNPNVFIAADLFWYPIEGANTIHLAPDVMLVWGRPKGERESYRQWSEGGIAPQAVFEIWSPSNRETEKKAKLSFYDKYGVSEYYTFDPADGTLQGWERRPTKSENASEAATLTEIQSMQNWQSPLLKIRFQVVNSELVVYRPDGRRFLSYLEQANLAEQEQLAKERAWARLRELGENPDKLLGK
jgi:Uma2 family endonuclease